MDEFELDTSSLLVYLSAQLTAALADLSTPDGAAPPEAWERFVGWVRKPHRSRPGPSYPPPTHTRRPALPDARPYFTPAHFTRLTQQNACSSYHPARQRPYPSRPTFHVRLVRFMG